jgi:hypothetical protein
MTREDLEELLIEKYQDYDTTVDATDGSRFRVTFLDPILDLLAVEDADTQQFILDRMTQEYPDLTLDESGGVLGDVFVKAPSLWLESIRRTVQQLRAERAGVGNPNALTTSSAADLASNFFVTRAEATYSTVPVRMYFSKPGRITLFVDNSARTTTGLKFLPATAIQITAEDLEAHRSGNLYYIDALFVAEKPGVGYEIPVNAIYTVDGVPGLVRATNLTASSSAANTETNDQLVTRILEGISDRSLVTERGISSSITEDLPEVAEVQVIGFGDPEMERDILTADVMVGTGTPATEASSAFGTGDCVQVTQFPSYPYTSLFAASGFTTGVVGDYLTVRGKDRVITQTNVDPNSDLYRVGDIIPKYIGNLAVSMYSVATGANIFKTPIATCGAALEDDKSGPVSLEQCFSGDTLMHQLASGGSWTEDAVVQTVDVANNQIRIVSDMRVLYSGGVSDSEAVAHDVGGTWYVCVPVTFDTPNATDYYISLSRKGVTATLLEFLILSTEDGAGYGEPGTRYYRVGTAKKYLYHDLLVNGAEYSWTIWTTTGYTDLFDSLGTGTTYHGVVAQISPNFSTSTLLPYDGADLAWSYRTTSNAQVTQLSITHVPGGITFPDYPATDAYPEGTILVANDSVHLGGKVDVYTFPRAEYTESTYSVNVLRDVEPLISVSYLSADGLCWDDGKNTVSSKALATATAANMKCAALMRWDGYKHTAMRVISASGTTMTVDPGNATHLFAETVASPGVSYYISSPYAQFSFKNPSVLKTQGMDLISGVGSMTVTTTADLGKVVSGDTLEITSLGPNKGRYIVNSVTSTTMTLTEKIPRYATGMSFKVYTELAAADTPVMGITSLEMFDAGGSMYVPHGKSVGLLVSRDFQDACGDVRAYFRDRTFFHVPHDAIFAIDEKEYTLALDEPTTVYENASSTSDADVVNTAGPGAHGVLTTTKRLDFAQAFLTGMKLVPQYQPILGVHSTLETANVAGLPLYMTIDGVDHQLTFSGMNPLPLYETAYPGGVVQQINRAFVGVTATKEDNAPAPGEYWISVVSNVPVTQVHGTAAEVLGFAAPGGETDNLIGTGEAEYEIDTISETGGTVTITTIGTITGITTTATESIKFKIVAEDGSDHRDLYVFPANMDYDENLGLYYTDFEIIASGHTDDENYDLSRGDALTLSHDDLVYYGYHLYNNENEDQLAFSVQEDLRLNISAWFLATDATNIMGDVGNTEGRVYLTPESSFAINYKTCPVTSSVQNYLTETTRRIVLADHLAKAAYPVWILGNIGYSDGDTADVLLPELRSLVRAIRFESYLDISNVRALFERYGASDFDDPSVMYAITCGPDRSYTMMQITNRITPERCYHLVDDPLLSAEQV